jgi:hypothetical protein
VWRDPQTVYLKNVIANDRIKVGDYTMSSLSTYPFPIFFEEWGLKVKEIQS